MIFWDSETRSDIDLPNTGAWKYFDSPHTEPLCISVAHDTEDKPYTLKLNDLRRVQYELWDRIREKEHIIVWNGDFEYLLYTKKLVPMGWPPVKYEQFVDVSLLYRMLGLPAALDYGARCASLSLGLPVMRKDAEGARVMRKFMRVQDEYWDDEEYEKLCNYCEQDVEITRFCFFTVPPHALEVHFKDQWPALTHEINDRGLKIDTQYVRNLLRFSEDEKLAACERMQELTGGKVQGPTKLNDIKDFIAMETGRQFTSLARDIIEEELDKEELPDQVLELLFLRMVGGRASTGKLEKILGAVGEDDRLRGVYYYWGARTRRFSSKIIQLHNLPRRGPNEPALIEEIKEMEDYETGLDVMRMFEGNVLDALPRFLRSTIIAEEGKKFIGGDFAQIEARMLALFAGEDEILEYYRQGKDPYIKLASELTGKPESAIYKGSDDRQLAKGIELGAGYGGWVGAVLKSAKKYGFSLKEEKAAEHAGKWREARPRTVEFWYELSQAAMKCWQEKRRVDCRRGIYFERDAHHLYLWLPSGRFITYPFVKAEFDEHREQVILTFVHGQTKMPQTAKAWARRSIWHGLLAENAIQGLCADLLMWMMERNDLVGHTHDEFWLEVEERYQVNNMPPLPNWCSDLPFEIEWWEGKRYGQK